jgi:hypothetical protein
MWKNILSGVKILSAKDGFHYPSHLSMEDWDSWNYKPHCAARCGVVIFVNAASTTLGYSLDLCSLTNLFA